MIPIVQRLGDLAARDPRRRRTRDWLIRGLGLAYFSAFASLWTQILGLAGSRGILPVADFLEAVNLSGLTRWLEVPTLCWVSHSDFSLLLQCGLGAACSLALIAGLCPGPLLAALWVLWLSLATACRDFLGFQWENLLLESGLLALLLAPGWRPLRKAPAPRRAIVWLFCWLLFRLMFLSGVVKLQSGDPSWRNFTALFYHFETQPLPTPLGWLAYQLPSKLLVAATGIMYLIELGAPFLIFAGRKARVAAAVSFVLLQAGIAITGNYCYFNFLTMLLCLPLLDDDFLASFRIRRGRPSDPPDPPPPSSAIVDATPRPDGKARLLVLAFASLLFLFSVVQTCLALDVSSSWPAPLLNTVRLIEPFRSVNNYGLFAVMTKTRPEIILEGSNDGMRWEPYEFRYKAGDLKRRPSFVAPHQPRLDWQMWFAALSDYQQNPWFVNFCVRLLQGEPQVLALLANTPFPNSPPKYLRAELYLYEFTSTKQRTETGEWWKREHLRPYFGPISLKPADPR